MILAVLNAIVVLLTGAASLAAFGYVIFYLFRTRQTAWAAASLALLPLGGLGLPVAFVKGWIDELEWYVDAGAGCLIAAASGICAASLGEGGYRLWFVAAPAAVLAAFASQFVEELGIRVGLWVLAIIVIAAGAIVFVTT